jgi:hypothetical protein
MSKEYTNGELRIMFENLCAKIDDGFKGVHERQDKTNGNVIRNTEFRLQATGSLLTLKVLIGIVGIGNIVALINYLSR